MVFNKLLRWICTHMKYQESSVLKLFWLQAVYKKGKRTLQLNWLSVSHTLSSPLLLTTLLLTSPPAPPPHHLGRHHNSIALLLHPQHHYHNSAVLLFDYYQSIVTYITTTLTVFFLLYLFLLSLTCIRCSSADAFFLLANENEQTIATYT